MIHFVVAFAVLIHVLFWGAGLAVVAMPRRWRRFWPMLAFPAGMALQSAVVWAGAWANLRGTNTYALPSELIPVALLWYGVSRRGWRVARGELWRWRGIGFAMAAGLALLVLPVALASRGLTTVSLGNNDAADYAAGARVLMEFAHSERGGFIGLTEVVRVLSVDNFFDFWLRLNHFTPSALMALNGSILHCAPHEMVGLLTFVVFAGTLPVVFWISRALVRLPRSASFVVTGIYGLSPIPWYAAAQVATAQLVVAPAIALLTWGGVALWRATRPGARGVQELFGVLMIGYVLVLGAYNFILLVCLAPAVMAAFGLAARRREPARAMRWLVAVLLPLVAAGVLFADRVAGLAERLRLFQTFDFGWRIPVFTPEGWLGLVRDTDLNAWAPAAIRWTLAALVLVFLGAALLRVIRRRDGRGWIAACLVVPPLVGYAFLEARGVLRHTNASYDAYKLWSVFYVGALPALGWMLFRAGSRRLGAVVLALVLAGNALVATHFVAALHQPPLVVDGELRQLRRIEAMPDVKSVNLIFAELDMWSRLWANELLLRKPQYFLTHTYEGRLNTPLRGEWDLEGGRVGTRLTGEGTRPLTPRFRLVDTRAPGFVRVLIGDGWYPEECLPATGERWQWTAPVAHLIAENPQAHAVRVVAKLDGRGFDPRDAVLVAEGQEARVRLSADRTTTAFPPLVLPPGRTELTLRAPALTPAKPGDDARPLAVCVFKLDFAPVE